MSKMPAQRPGKSYQAYRTPEAFLAATKSLLGIEAFVCDLAADQANAVADLYFDEETNALAQSWVYLAAAPEDILLGATIAAPRVSHPHWNWLNPPFADLYPWAKKAFEESTQGAKVAMLIPLSTAEWWADYVHGMAHVKLLQGRLCFIHDWAHTIDPATLKPGKGPARFYSAPPLYPKDCALLLYGDEARFPIGYDLWDWRKQLDAPTPHWGPDVPLLEDAQ